jgi:orotidine-5'-phosphate decarboxylase
MTPPITDRNRIIVALDVDNENDAYQLLDQLDNQKCRVKVGKQLFTSCGPSLVKQLVSKGFDVFLDLKFHDIPNTVAGAVKAAADLGVWMVNIHASGGRAMMEAAAGSLSNSGSQRPLLTGVTVLTSLAKEDLLEIGIDALPEVQVKRLAELSVACGLDGVVCSAAETEMLSKLVPPTFCIVNTGIRRPADVTNAQKRVVGPEEAIRNGSTYLVVGRPITQADSPQESLAAFYEAVSGVL